MQNDVLFDKPFCEKRFVAVSICQSNIKSKKDTYYGRVCKTGHLNTKQILQIVKDKSPYIDIPMVESALEKIADVILDMVAQGYNVDLANLGTFSLSTKGKIKMSHEEFAPPLNQAKSYDSPYNSAKNQEKEDEITDENELCGCYDVSNKVKSDLQFTFKFSPSKALKASMKNIRMSLAIKKKTAPIIEKVENALPERIGTFPQILNIVGNNLKIAGDDERIGIYIEEKFNEANIHPLMMSYQEKLKINKSSLIHNNNKTLTLVLDRQLKKGVQYYITIITQSTLGGKVGKKLRKGKICTYLS